MPALAPVNKVLKIQYGFTIGEDLAARCHEFWSYVGTASSGDLTTLATTMGGDWASNMLGVYDPNTALTSITLTDLTAPTAGFGLWSGSHVGTDSGDPLPASACVLESLHIGRRYRGGHPRIYWPFGQADQMADPQTWSSGFVASVTAALLAFRNDWTTDLPPAISSVAQVAVSYYGGFTTHTGTTGRVRNVSTPLVSPIVDVVIAHAVHQGIASQRKRLLRLA